MDFTISCFGLKDIYLFLLNNVHELVFLTTRQRGRSYARNGSGRFRHLNCNLGDSELNSGSRPHALVAAYTACLVAHTLLARGGFSPHALLAS